MKSIKTMLIFEFYLNDPFTLPAVSISYYHHVALSSLTVLYFHSTPDWFQFGFLSMLFLLHIHHILDIKFSSVVLYSSPSNPFRANT